MIKYLCISIKITVQYVLNPSQIFYEYLYDTAYIEDMQNSVTKI